MNHSHQSHQPYKASNKLSSPKSRGFKITLAIVAGLILLNLLIPHRNHVIDALPYILIVAMLIMHLGGHGGHNHGGSKQ